MKMQLDNSILISFLLLIDWTEITYTFEELQSEKKIRTIWVDKREIQNDMAGG